MPRVYELMSLIEDRCNPRAYFQSFGETVRTEPSKRQAWLAWEREFSRLDQCSWDYLKAEALPYLTSRDGLRGWSQLIAILNQVRAYNFLVDEGCLNVRFIPRATTKGMETPDLEAEAERTKILCEVKSVQISDAEAARRACGGVGSSTAQLEAGFFTKLTSDLSRAKQQMYSFNGSPGMRRIAFVILDFDDWLGEYKQSFFQQIDEFLASKPVPDIDVVFYNKRTAFHVEVALRHAMVVNEVAG
jgi:hypothetical protein